MFAWSAFLSMAISSIRYVHPASTYSLLLTAILHKWLKNDGKHLGQHSTHSLVKLIHALVHQYPAEEFPRSYQQLQKIEEYVAGEVCVTVVAAGIVLTYCSPQERCPSMVNLHGMGVSSRFCKRWCLFLTSGATCTLTMSTLASEENCGWA